MSTTAPDRGLVVVGEDEPSIAELERLYLRREGYAVLLASSGDDVLAAVRTNRPVAIVLDIGLPGLDGISVCRALRDEDDWTPLLFVTARDDEADRLIGLGIGADDYITKPFSPRELVARVRTVTRRAGQAPATASTTTLAVGQVVVDPDTHTVTAAGAPVELTTTEFHLLEYLLRHPGRVHTREQLLRQVWGYAHDNGSRTVDVHVAQLRAKLGDASPIRTVRGVGYSAAR